MSSEMLKTATSDYESQIFMKKHLISQRIISKKIGDGQPNAKRTLPSSPPILDQEARNQQRKLNLSQTLLGHQVPETENEKIQTRFCQPQAFKFVICYHSKSHQKRVANFIQEALLVQRKLLQKEAQNGQRSESQLRAINNASQLSNMPPVLWQFLKRFYWTLGSHSDYQDITPQQVYNINQAMISFTPRDFLKFMDLHSTLQMRDGSELFTLFIKEALQGEFNFTGTINAYRDQFNTSAVSSEMGSPERQGRNIRARISTAPVTVSNSMRRQRLA
ncbi:hypothetical protein FGO68_gene15148 [Halteria grandinella]|uniref:Uncharacterized protein n=1 Tax=Halteria grandinella TaxID=5974 RepID=A0A8J8P2I2_HALGN|nr:hypothetical protein FGO68_gene15148 [Halteria grandinella]